MIHVFSPFAYWAFADLGLNCIYCAMTCPKISATKGLCERRHMSHVQWEKLPLPGSLRVFFFFLKSFVFFTHHPHLHFIHSLNVFVCFRRIIIYCFLHPYIYLISHVLCLFLPLPLPSHFLFLYLSHTETDTPLSLSFSPVLVMVCQSVRVPHSGGFSEWVTGPALLFSDTCQSLICHLCAEMEMSGSDTTCQRWRWRLTSLRQPLNQLHISRLVCRLANNNYLLPAFRRTLFVVQWCHTTQAAELGCCGCGVGIMHGECPSAIWELMQTHSVCIQACICWKQFHFSSFTRLSTSAIKCTITHFTPCC